MEHPIMLGFIALPLLFPTSLAVAISDPVHENKQGLSSAHRHVEALILGGGVAGVIAARTFHEEGIDDFLIVEARNELGGRLKSATFGGKTIELGANWIQGTQTGNGPENPILTLAKKHNLRTQYNDLFGSLTTYDNNGAVNYLDVVDTSIDAFVNHTIYSGTRLTQNLVDLSSRSAYDLIGVKPRDIHAKAAEYFNVDFEYAQKPDQNSAIAGSWNNNFTYDIDQGGFSEENLLSIDQRGFKAFIQEEANTFLKPRQLRLKSTVKSISWSDSGVRVVLKDGTTISANYALCTFSLGVLQNDDVLFIPKLPGMFIDFLAYYKLEAIASMTMATYTKIFLKFPKKFWFDTEMALYADPERGHYPVWQSLDHKHFLPGSGLIFVTVTGDYSKRIEALPDSQVKAEVLNVLQSMFPNITVPPPLDFYFPRWTSDPLYRGSYSNWPPSFVQQHHVNLRSNVDRLYFAGEATSMKYYGFLHGAYFEGLDVAQSIIKCITHQSCVRVEHFDKAQNGIPYDI
ncbi:Polyamine oxidase [Termitomyces sp. J132]|nr:Polyamine oxidase [Termitomyces sp. J132]